MSRKSKSVQPLAVLSPKISNRAYLQGLQGEVEASRVAVQNITRLSTGEQKFNNKIGQIQQELQACISNITNQSKKQRILIELIALLKGEMFKYQTTKKKEEEAQSAQREKQTCKIQYEIDQLLQKHNEEVAKIHQLKDVANSKRSQRVVYSNLFKKLQKQIKFYQQLYKEAIIRTQTTKNKENTVQPAQNTAVGEQKLNITSLITKESSQDIFTSDKRSIKRISQKKAIVINEPHESQPTNNFNHEWTVFMTAQKEENQREEHRKFLQINQEQHYQSRLSFRNTVYREERIQHIKDTIQKISHFNHLIDNIKTFVDFCSTVPTEDVLDHYSDLQMKNNTLEVKIYDADEEISRKQFQNKAFEEKLKQIEFQRKYSLMSPPSIIHKKQSLISVEPAAEEDQQKEIKQMFNEICIVSDLLGFKAQRCQQLAKLVDYQNHSMLPEQEIKSIDNKMSRIISVGEPIELKKIRLRQETSNSEPAVESLLEKMEKFGNCERILDKTLFQQEYYKELSKRKGKQSRK